jgi:hypothetical protein
MNKLFALLAVSTTLVAAAPALANDTVSMEAKHSIKKSDGGNIKEKYSKVTKDAAGTKSVTKVDAKVDVDRDGNVTKKLETVESTDPKGLMNKEKTKTKEVVKTKNGRTETTVKKTVNGDTVINKTTVSGDFNHNR